MPVCRRGSRAALGLLSLMLVGSHYAARVATVAVEQRYEIAYATYLGGSMWDQAREVIPYSDGSVLIGAQTSSEDIATTGGVVQPDYACDDPNLGHGGIYGGDCYVARLSADGSSILAATYFGGSKQERNVYGMELDGDGHVVITSMMPSRDLPTTESCFQPDYGGGQADCFAAKLSYDLRAAVDLRASSALTATA